MELPGWVAGYIGIPFADHGRDRMGVDCYGLIYLVVREQFGMELPRYDEDYPTALDRAEVSALVSGEIKARWREIVVGNELVGDVALFRMMGVPCHVGLVVEPSRRLMIHCPRGANACLQCYQGPKWAHRLDGFFRHDCRDS